MTIGIRIRSLTIALALLLIPLLVGPALGAPSVEIEWATTGSGPIANPNVVAEVGDTLTATIYLENVGGTIYAYTLEVDFDAVELSLISATEFLPLGFSDNLNVGTGNFGLCSGLLIEAVVLPPDSGVAGRFAIGEVVLEVISVINDGTPDLVTGSCSGTSDQALYDGTLVDVTGSTTFEVGGSGVVAVPVPALGRSMPLMALAALLISSTLVLLKRRA